jgi:hypothetical protein
MGKQYLSESVAPGVVLNPAVGEGLSLYEPGIAPAMGVDIAHASPPGVVLDKSYDEIQAMAQPKHDWMNGLVAGAIGAGLASSGKGGRDSFPAPSSWRPSSLPPVPVAPSYAQGVYMPQSFEELLQRNGPLMRRLTYNFTKGGGA